MMDSINMELLISMVKNKPGLWDKKSDLYNIRQANYMAWRKICKVLVDGFEMMSETEKTEIRIAVVKKWNNARDNWMKCHKRIKSSCNKNGRDIRKYRYYDQMIFLTKVVRARSVESDVPTPEINEETTTNIASDVESDDDSIVLQIDTKSEDDSDNTQDHEDQQRETVEEKEEPKRAVKRKGKGLEEKHTYIDRLTPVIPEGVGRGVVQKYSTHCKEEKVTSNSTGNEDNGRIMSFFRGIAPTVEKFSDDAIVEFQYEVIKAMRNISRKNHASHCVFLPNS